ALERDQPSLEQLGEDLKVIEARLRDLTGQRDSLAGQRRELLGDLDPRAELARLEKLIQLAEEEVLKQDQLVRQTESSLKIHQDRFLELDRSLAERREPLARQAGIFSQALSAKGLSSREDFLSARLEAADREKLAREQKRLQEAAAAAESIIQDKTKELDLLAAAQKTAESAGQLTIYINDLAGQLKDIRRQMGALEQRLADDQTVRTQAAGKLAEMDTQRQVCLKWEKLNGLIGSAEGTKYRNFAQSLTFEVLIRSANIQLQKMYPRYLLGQDPQAALEFNVTDNLQAGLQRSTKNLSGGESFLVSLALALGLSAMSGGNVRISSLFLDEGFGTLDDESLDMALSALSDLPQAEGKTIGLISHVSALKERISTQITVTPLTGGRSQIFGPGCRRIDT
ncbi:MAG: hypothetical protein LBK52_01750, partial [Deltaproteobacteria bacterium]|nr:hypothetical protein [Deltaproteobacteria bacterium]